MHSERSGNKELKDESKKHLRKKKLLKQENVETRRESP